MVAAIEITDGPEKRLNSWDPAIGTNPVLKSLVGASFTLHIATSSSFR